MTTTYVIAIVVVIVLIGLGVGINRYASGGALKAAPEKQALPEAAEEREDGEKAAEESAGDEGSAQEDEGEPGEQAEEETGQPAADEDQGEPSEEEPVEETAAEEEPVEDTVEEETVEETAQEEAGEAGEEPVDEQTPAQEEAEEAAEGDQPEHEEAEEETAEEPALDTPEPVVGRMARLRSRLANSGAFGRALLSVFSRGDLLMEDWEEIEDTLLMADLGVEATDELMEELRTQAKVLGTSDTAKIKEVLHAKLLELLDPNMDRSLNLDKIEADGAVLPATILTVGVNGTGKTTTIGKIARMLVSEKRSVLLGAADTFRAAAADQLETWGQRVGVDVVRSDKEGADPASVAFDAVDQGVQRGVDVVIVDTAGRLQNKAGLMDELGKVKRVMEKKAPVGETLLVLDATTGQNGLQQARVFADVVDVTGIVLTKLDGSAKGGIVVRVQRELGVPVKLVGLGEGPDDLVPFSPDDFAKALIEDPSSGSN